MNGIQVFHGRPLTDDQIQLYRVAGLLHDIGHYPFSHVMDHAVRNFYLESMVDPQRSQSEGAATNPSKGNGPMEGLSHERVATVILDHDPSVREVLKRFSIDPKSVADIITRANPEESPALGNLISSDLDADKIDYLLRTANSTGLPYGQVDLPYLATSARLDAERTLCFSDKAVRIIDHLMLARYFDRMQVAFHKTVAGFELILGEVLQDLLRAGLMSLSASDIQAYVKDPLKWSEIDDAYVTERIRKLSKESSDQAVRDRAKSILSRQPPKQVGWMEYFGGRDDRELYERYVERVKEKLPEWAKTTGIPEEYWKVWQADGFTLTSLASTVPIPISPKEKFEPEKLQQSVHVLVSGSDTATPIVRLRSSMMSILSDKAFFALRIYVLRPEGANVTAAELRRNSSPRPKVERRAVALRNLMPRRTLMKRHTGAGTSAEGMTSFYGLG